MSNKPELSAKDFEESVKRQQLDSIVNNIDNSFNEIVGQDTHGKLPENLFVRDFLPFFSGQVPLNKASQHYQYWIGIAGTPMNEVDIIDNKGNTIFTVPPLMNADFINPNKRHKAMGDIFTEQSLHSSHSPAAGNSYLARELSQRVSEFEDNSKPLLTYEQRWSQIFNRYGVSATSEDRTNNVGRTTSNNGDDVEDLIYD